MKFNKQTTNDKKRQEKEEWKGKLKGGSRILSEKWIGLPRPISSLERFGKFSSIVYTLIFGGSSSSNYGGNRGG